MTREIPLSRGKVALVDDADYERVSSVRWYARPATNRPEVFYVQRWTPRASGTTTIYLHRYLLTAPAHLWVDHINGDGLDNRRANLRLCRPGLNSVNRLNRNSHGFLGVEKSCQGERWGARVHLDGVTHRGGWFDTPEEAARARDALAIKIHGEFARLNFPHEHGRTA